MKRLLPIIVGTLIVLSGLPPAFGFSLFNNRGKTQSVNRWPYSFGDRYIYDNGGSSWNYDRPHKHRKYRFHRENRHKKQQHMRFQNLHKRPATEKLDRLIRHFTRNG